MPRAEPAADSTGSKVIQIRAVVFDLAGVLLDFRGVESLTQPSGDDNLECVEGARSAGMQAYQCAGIRGVQRELQKLRLLPARLLGTVATAAAPDAPRQQLVRKGSHYAAAGEPRSTPLPRAV